MKRIKLIGIGVSLLLLPCLLSAAETRITIETDQQESAISIPPEFLGLSMETSTLLREGTSEAPYLKADNRALIQLFKTLGVKNLRIGGNTADRPTLPEPQTQEIDDFFAFAKAAKVKVIYTLRLRDSSSEAVTKSARYIVSHYGDQIDCLAIGNEPNVYEHQYAKYAQDEKASMASVHAEVPKAKFCGPGTNISGDAPWANGYLKDFGKDPDVLWLTQHAYPGGNSRKVPDPATGRERMLSPEFEQIYQRSYEAFGPAAQAAGVRYRIEETNSYYNGGAEGASNTFASALWALDYLYFWLEHNAQGVNFHTGNKVAAGEVQTPCWYATFWNQNSSLDIHPIAYAIKAFDVAAHGHLVPVKTSVKEAAFAAYATISQDKSIYLTLINKSHDQGARVTKVGLDKPKGYSHAALMSLIATDGNVGATSGVLLGGASIQPDGTWNGQWKERKSAHGETIDLNIPPASALIVRLTR